MKEEKQKNLFMIGMSILLLLVLIGGGTYAWLTLSLKGTKVNVLRAGDLSLVLDDINSIGINQEKAVPTLDEVGETFDPYHFTLENLSDIPSEYTIYLDNVDLEEGEVRMEDEYLRYSLVKDKEKNTNDLSSIGSHPARILDSGTIEGGKKITYDLRLWIDINAGNDAMNKVFRSKIRVVAVQEEVVKGNPNILHVYRYDLSGCITGEESTCVELTERPATYAPGTIVKYEVSDSETKYFHVIRDNEDGTLTMQQRENTIYATPWYEAANDNSKGPLTVLPLLENATKDWTNVLDQKYTMGVTPFQDNVFTGCTYDDMTKDITCGVHSYTLGSRTAKARMITAQEASHFGCKMDVAKTCPVFMYNYLFGAEEYGGSETGTDWGYWTMSAYSLAQGIGVYRHGYVGHNLTTDTYNGARAVVVIDK